MVGLGWFRLVHFRLLALLLFHTDILHFILKYRSHSFLLILGIKPRELPHQSNALTTMSPLPTYKQARQHRTFNTDNKVNSEFTKEILTSVLTLIVKQVQLFDWLNFLTSGEKILRSQFFNVYKKLTSQVSACILLIIAEKPLNV